MKVLRVLRKLIRFFFCLQLSLKLFDWQLAGVWFILLIHLKSNHLCRQKRVTKNDCWRVKSKQPHSRGEVPSGLAIFQLWLSNKGSCSQVNVKCHYINKCATWALVHPGNIQLTYTPCISWTCGNYCEKYVGRNTKTNLHTNTHTHTDSSRCSLLDVDEDRWAVIILIRAVMSSREDVHLDQRTPGETKRKCMCLSENRRRKRGTF